MKKTLLLLLVCLSNGWLFANHWTPNASEYENNMTLTGVIQINGVEQQSTTLEVGVFCGEECRGSGYAVYFFPTQRYVIQLLVFGENGNPLTFKLYDSSMGQEIDMDSPDPVIFNTNGYGSLSDPYVLNFTGSVDQNYTITTNTYPENGGTVVGAGSYHEGQTCTLVAMPNAGYAFSNWTENGALVSANSTYSFTVTSNRSLVANFIATGNENHWVPNDSDYENNMTLTGVIQINGVEQQSATLEVGVFCGEECRGVGMPTYFFPTQRYVIQLLIFGEIGDQLTFKLYDHELGQELNLTSPEAITFVANGYGSLDNPYVLNFTGESGEISQTISLSAGWNWCSFNVDITLNDLKAALVEALPGTSITIKSQNNNNTTYNGIRWRGQLTTLDVTQMYRIWVSTDCEITLEGTPLNPAEHPITISNGVNWIGFPFSESMSHSDAFADAVSGDVVKSKVNGIAIYNGTTWRGTLNTLVPGQGYIYKSTTTEDRILTFPVGTK